MASLSEAKTLGGIGSILVLLTAVPSVGWLLGIVGFVMILAAVSYISDLVRDRSIFNNMLTSIVLAIGGIAVGTIVILGSVFSFMSTHNLAGPDFFGQGFNPATVPTSDWISLATSVLAGLAALWVLITVSAVFLRRSYNAIGSKLNVGMFGTAGMLYLIGAATTIIGIGFLLIFVAQILLAVAFFSIEESVPQVVQPQAVPVNR